MRKSWEFIKAYYTVLVIIAVYAWALVAVCTYRMLESPPGTITLRIGHWQLETGVRDAFIELAKDYQKLHPNVRIVQDAVPEGVYGQWLSTQIMGETSPDMIEIGMIPYQVMLSFYNRYCFVLTPYVDKPNPYNAGTDLEGTSWRSTFKDGMAAGYVNEMQEYMGVPLASFTTRVFYNKDLLLKLTGSGTPPKTYREFYELCRKISSLKDELGRNYTPIVGSKYHFGIWEQSLCDIMTYKIKDRADFNRDGYVGSDELFIAVKSGMFSFADRPVAAKYQMVGELAGFCQAGFTGLSRDEGVFLFAQQRAVFMTTGTWDALSLQDQAKGKFTVAVMDFPMPATDDPVYGDVSVGPRYENPGTGFNFAITRTSKHPEIALDFLLFLSSKAGNEKMNKIIGWIPSVTGTELVPMLKDFKPCLSGIYSNFQPNLGGETWIKWMQLTSLYQVSQISFEDMIKEFEPFYKSKGEYDFNEQMKDRNRILPRNERFNAGIRAQAMMEENPDKAQSFWIKYRSQTSGQVGHEIWTRTEMDWAKNGPPSKEYGPYEYSPEVLKKAKEKFLKGRLSGSNQ